MPVFKLPKNKIVFPDPALVMLAQRLAEKGFGMIDCQFHTDFLESMGGEYISYKEYTEILNRVKEKHIY